MTFMSMTVLNFLVGTCMSAGSTGFCYISFNISTWNLPFELQLLAVTSVKWFTLQIAALTIPGLCKNPFLLTCYVSIQSLWKVKGE